MCQCDHTNEQGKNYISHLLVDFFLIFFLHVQSSGKSTGRRRPSSRTERMGSTMLCWADGWIFFFVKELICLRMAMCMCPGDGLKGFFSWRSIPLLAPSATWSLYRQKITLVENRAIEPVCNCLLHRFWNRCNASWTKSLNL
jgi:hypothetical protein